MIFSVPPKTRKFTIPRVQRAWEFLQGPLWDIDLDSAPRARAFFYRQLRVLYIVVSGALRGQVPLRASSLTYISLLSLVPILTVMLMLVKGLSGMETVQVRLQEYILQNVAAGNQQVVREYLMKFLRNIRGGAIEGISVAFLFYTVISLLSHIEEAFNEIWGIRNKRPFIERVKTYLVSVLVGPPLLGLSLTMTASLQNAAAVEWLTEHAPWVTSLFTLTPVIVTWIAFTLMYRIMPNTRIPAGAAVAGGVIGGTIWEIAKFGYTIFSKKAVTYSAIYGPLAAIPLFFIWVYITWLVVLFGAQVAFANQVAATFEIEERALNTPFRARLRAAMLLMIAIARDFYDGVSPRTDDELARDLGIPVRLAREVLHVLAGQRLLLQINHEDSHAYAPGRSIDTITLYDVASAMSDCGTFDPKFRDSETNDLVASIFNQLDEDDRRTLGTQTLHAIVAARPEERRHLSVAGA
ncbi:MAG: hypothetical protein GMKNLPBB_02782 [Myxococcota bacterium]|nr:hypothetical protein [Myxococcota bacterium]